MRLKLRLEAWIPDQDVSYSQVRGRDEGNYDVGVVKMDYMRGRLEITEGTKMRVNTDSYKGLMQCFWARI